MCVSLASGPVSLDHVTWWRGRGLLLPLETVSVFLGGRASGFTGIESWLKVSLVYHWWDLSSVRIVMCIPCVYLAVSRSLCLESVVSPALRTLHYVRKFASPAFQLYCHVHTMYIASCVSPLGFRKCTSLSCSVLCHTTTFHLACVLPQWG